MRVVLPILRCVLAAALVGGCRSKTADDTASAAQSTASVVEAAVEHAPPASERCRHLPPRPPRVNPDWPSPRNSDGTPKRLPSPPETTPGRTLLFQYDDFGPQVLAGKLLGPEWWSWEGGGSFEPGDEFDVRVVVYAGTTAEDVRERFPTLRGRSDYRIVSRSAALGFLDDALAELQPLPTEEPLASLERRLRQTRRTIVGCLSE